jgi:hypothetical protein
MGDFLPAALSKDDASLRTGTWTVNPTPETLNGGLYTGPVCGARRHQRAHGA